jgi:tetratricopeptide (TPR) repeat protein
MTRAGAASVLAALSLAWTTAAPCRTADPATAPASAAPGPEAPPPPPSPEAAGSAPAAEPGAGDEPAPAPVEPSDDTRSSAMRALEKALSGRRLAATAPLSQQRLREELTKIEEMLATGRRDEAIGDLVYLVESPRFEAFATTDEGRVAVYLLGDALGRAGAYEPARGYLIRLLTASPSDGTYRRAVASLADLALASDRPEDFLPALDKVPASAPEEVRGDVSYVRGRLAERAGDRAKALAAYTAVGERSRFWAQATYLAGVLEVDQKNFKRGEELFCRVADPKRTPRKAALFGGSDFFRVRDLSRLGLGRLAHEQYRFDDARYYYYLVPNDSERLPEALYETATTRYEAKDYDGAREALDQLARLKISHPYEDEAIILDAYLDLAVCRFPSADEKLITFLKRYEPARNAARRLLRDSAAMRRLVDAVRTGADPAGAGLGVSDGSSRALGAILRIDAGYRGAARRVAELDHQLSGLRFSMQELDEVGRRMAMPNETRPQAVAALGDTSRAKLSRIETQLVELKRLIRDAERGGVKGDLDGLRQELEALELRARALSRDVPRWEGTLSGKDELEALIQKDRDRATELYAAAEALRRAVIERQLVLAKDAFVRLDRRLTRLLNRARLGRVETVLGRKKALEIEVDALSQGLLPQTIVDSLRAERYLGDDEEYWPFEGEDWADEYVGGEGLR